MAALSPCDPCSFSRPDQCRVVNIHLDLEVDFGRKVILGTVHLSVERKSKDDKVLILDSNELNVEKVSDQAKGQELQYSLGEPVKPFGSKLEIVLPTSDSNQFVVSIKYSTSPTCSALQWLRAEQTAGKRHPYLFSQCQAIHARSLYPCQDTPGVKFTYTAKVKAPQGVVILMSAVRLTPEECPDDTSCMVHRFEQKVPIPSYLLAIVGGDIESRSISPRSRVWSEKEQIEEAEYEFGETEQMLKTAEDLLGPYEWGQYDLLVLPPSFPYGGMENPCLTFVTPTLLAGDRSLADVVAHEISHSWTGNLVTNSTFEDFWLNEGHTMFVERKIASRMHGGEPLLHFKASEGWEELRESVNRMMGCGEGPYTKLVPDLKGVDPDDAFSTVPYEKGFALLFYLENLLGGPEIFEKFLRAYISKFRRQSITTQQWKDFLFSYFTSESDKKKLEGVDWEAWFSAEGMPNIQPKFNTSLAKPCQDLSARWLAASDSDLSSFGASDLEKICSLQKREFLSLMLQSSSVVSVAKLEKMDQLYNFSAVKNSEIRFRWLRLGIKSRWSVIIPKALQFVTEQGRMKFVRPIYRDLYQWEDARQSAIDNFLRHREEMHNTTAKEVAKDLHLNL
ncbi:leukotriene A-4 hydrolase-like isoform X1 [Babylonia areolata]|uniref:leukotriene A-4 hydrolase-like isoform X1 n=1 Tax=Babylonia areolata TaxID=304850 RepID=UPI003FD5F993